MIQPQCDVITCGQELLHFGGVLVGPLGQDGTSTKLHVCATCYQKVRKYRSSICRHKIIELDANAHGPILLSPPDKRKKVKRHDLSLKTFKLMRTQFFKKK